MPAIIDSAPDCVKSGEAYNADDVADFIVNDNYVDCAGFMTFGPGTTYGEEGAAAAGSYYALIGIGAAVVLLAFVLWLILENRRLIAYAVTRGHPPTPPSLTEAGGGR
jgi:hypothetical protein